MSEQSPLDDSADTTIYLVQGECGEYEDQRNWLVRAYLDKSAAEAHADRAQKRATTLHRQSRNVSFDKLAALQIRNEEDSKMQLDYSGAPEYSVVDLPLAKVELEKLLDGPDESPSLSQVH